jgi:hypothetical protein
MADPATHRVWASLTDSETAAVTQAAAERGIRPSELTRLALLAFIDRPALVPVAPSADAAPPVLARLDALADTLGRHVADLARLVPVTDDALAERDEVRGMLSDIAHAVGVLAGSLVPDDDDVEAAFGPDRD